MKEAFLSHDDMVRIALWLDFAPLKETTKCYIMMISALLTITGDEVIKAIKEKDFDKLKECFE